MKRWFAVLSILSGVVFADTQTELTVKVFWENEASQFEFVPVFQRLVASQVANGDIKTLRYIPENNQICAIHSTSDQYVRTVRLLRPVVEASGATAAFGVEACD